MTQPASHPASGGLAPNPAAGVPGKAREHATARAMQPGPPGLRSQPP